MHSASHVDEVRKGESQSPASATRDYETIRSITRTDEGHRLHEPRQIFSRLRRSDEQDIRGAKSRNCGVIVEKHRIDSVGNHAELLGFDTAKFNDILRGILRRGYHAVRGCENPAHEHARVKPVPPRHCLRPTRRDHVVNGEHHWNCAWRERAAQQRRVIDLRTLLPGAPERGERIPYQILLEAQEFSSQAIAGDEWSTAELNNRRVPSLSKRASETIGVASNSGRCLPHVRGVEANRQHRRCALLDPSGQCVGLTNWCQLELVLASSRDT